MLYLFETLNINANTFFQRFDLLSFEFSPHKDTVSIANVDWTD